MIFAPGRTVRVGVIGLSQRSTMNLRVLYPMEDIVIAGICDRQPGRIDNIVKVMEEKGLPKPFTCTDYHELLNNKDLGMEAIFVFTDWNNHTKPSITAMRAGYDVALEVGGAYSVSECWDLVHTSEETGKICMMLENCCYDRNELRALNMIKKGIFGELITCHGGYQHDLLEHTALGTREGHYRQKNFSRRNGELYPTHSMGPIGKYLSINRGNRITHLTSMGGKAVSMKNYWRDNMPDNPYRDLPFTQADFVTTTMVTALGETITLHHDCTLPRPYSRGGRVQGTKGLWMEDKNALYIKGISPEDSEDWTHQSWWEHVDKHPEWEHPLHLASEEHGAKGVHGGCDFLVFRAFIEAVQKHVPPPIDVYDTAMMMVITVLSEQSVATGGMPQFLPDFTNGAWLDRKPPPPSIYALDDVYEELFP